MKALAIIPARGGSKGIPRKNLQRLAGKPLLCYAIENALQSRHVDRVIVSTEDAEIADLASRSGAEVFDRPPQLSQDESSSESVLLSVLDELERRNNHLAEVSAFLQCTAPFTLPEDIDGTIHTLLQNGADSALAVTRFHGFLWRVSDGDAAGINHDPRLRLPRQQRHPEFLEAGSVYAFRTEGFRKARHRFFGKTVLYEIPGNRALEIDEPEDLLRAEALLSLTDKRRSLRSLPFSPEAVVFDFDGVFTDNRVLVSEQGIEAVFCNRSDGLGLTLLRRKGLPMLVISAERNLVVSKRCHKLGLECRQAVENKHEVLLEWLEAQHVEPQRTIYMGNDANDVECMNAVGCGVAVADAHPSARRAASFVLDSAGGRGAVRELCDLILGYRDGKNA